MPASLALVKAYWDGAGRQRAVSLWSMGSWGGSGFAALFGGLIAANVGWRWIFFGSAAVSLVGMLLVRGTLESREETGGGYAFDTQGILAFLVAMALVQVGSGMERAGGRAAHAGVRDLHRAFIRVGEKLLQRLGPRTPMIWGCLIVGATILLLTPAYVTLGIYKIVAITAFTLYGIGLAFSATPSTDAALANLPDDRAGAGSGIYKMASSLGASFGVAISAAVFTALSADKSPANGSRA
jgi:DHA2 family multidrug resistance protein-like MFS transporter